jgi:hypothetical protein
MDNVEYLVNKINGYQKNTVFVQPQLFQDSYQPNNQKIEIKLPQNAIIDLHTLCMTFDLQLIPATVALSNTFGMRPPRYSSSLIRRLDVYVGGMQVGLSNLSDYGSIDCLRKYHVADFSKMSEFSNYEMGGSFTADYNGGIKPGYVGDTFVALTPLGQATITSGGSGFYKSQITNFLGLLEGNFMRFLDTNLLPDVTIQITLAPATVFENNSNAATQGGTYALSNIKMYMELVKFGDSAYEKMVEARLSTGQPIVVPFTNWANFEQSSQVSAANVVTLNSGGNAATQFVIATQSLDRLWGSLRVGDYDSQTSFYVTNDLYNDTLFRRNTCGATLNNYYFMFCQMQNDANFVVPNTQGQFNRLVNGASTPVMNEVQPTESNLTGPARYQFEVDSKLYPQFLADVTDCYALTKNALDRSGGNMKAGTFIDDPVIRACQAFALVVSFKHNQPATEDRLISGLNTMGSNLPVRFSAYNIGLPGTNLNSNTPNFVTTQVRPVVFAEMTSSMLVYAGRVVSVIN